MANNRLLRVRLTLACARVCVFVRVYTSLALCKKAFFMSRLVTMGIAGKNDTCTTPPPNILPDPGAILLNHCCPSRPPIPL